MGRAVIVENKGDGLYTARPAYDLRRLDAELKDMQDTQSAYSATLGRAVLTLSLLEDETEIARAAMNQVINQWQQDLLNSGNPPPLTPPTEDDPGTGLPWDPADKAQEGPLFDAINAARTGAGKAALTRDDDLDFAARRHVYDMSGHKLMGHIGSDKSVPSSRVAATGYQSDMTVELLSCGALTASGAVNSWTRNSSHPLFSDVATQVGVAYTYSANHPATHIWVALLAHPDPDPNPSPPTVTYPDDPAQAAAREQEAGIEKIEPPRTETTTPEKLGDAVRKFGIAAGKEAAARRELARILAEYDRRLARIDELTALKTALAAQVYDVWATFYTETLVVGTEYSTAEPPGWNRNDSVTPGFVETGGVYPQTVYVEERPWNLAPFNESQVPPGRISPAVSASPESVFYNSALEPGHFKWKPLWRYATITSLNKPLAVCDLTLEVMEPRQFVDEDPKVPMDINATATLSNVVISYPPCNGYGFEEGDEVLVLFEGQDRDNPKVVGFRRAPRDCNGREDWLQL
ncbi:MAG: CAP domain-containing protein [Candidatus Competibacteraceae bacterium]|nr:CAP domain-containing protein [Candidatus Competibacteraceae bacterium]